jgi:hypothetical protein
MDSVGTQPESAAASSRRADRLPRSDHLVLLMAIMGLAGSALLANPAPPAREWSAGSLLQDIVRAVSLGYQLPTLRGIEVKTLAVSIISGLLLVAASFRVLRGRLRLLPDLPDAGPATGGRASAGSLSLVAVMLLTVWALASAFWARDGAVALGSTWVLSLGWVWAAGLALHGRRRLVRPMTDAMLAVASVTAILSLWYWHERATEMRLNWPLGNPLSLASVMVPAVLLAAGRLAEQIARVVRAEDRPRAVGAILLYAAITALALATLLATGSRGPLLAVAMGVAVAIWVAVSRQQRVAVTLVGVLLLALVAPAGIEWLFTAGGGRDASARMRVYAWRDALQLAMAKPAAGHGAGAYALLSTAMATHDCIIDPLAMSGQVSSDAHCEPLELLADLGVFGGVLCLAAWGFAIVAAGSAARGPDRWIAAAIAAAVTAAFVDASTGVSWRLPGPGPFLAMPAALAWMLWRDSPSPARNRVGRRVATMGSVLALAGVAVAAAGIADFAAAHFLYRGQVAMLHAERMIVLPAATQPSGDAAVRRAQTTALMLYAVHRADLAFRWQMDPPRKLVALLAAGAMRGTLSYLPLLQKGPETEAVPSQLVLDDGLWLLRRLRSLAPDYADTDWKIAELLGTKANLSRVGPATAPVADYREQSLGEALQYFGTHPLDRERIWQALAIWPEIPPAQRLSLLRGTLREEGEVWRAQRPTAPAYVRWSQQQVGLLRLWRQLDDGAAGVEAAFMEIGYSALRIPYAQWQDPLAPEGVRLAAVRRLMQGEPDQAADALELADLLYERAGGLLPYSQAANCLDQAACRIRQGSEQAAYAVAAIARGRRILQPLPDNPVRKQLLELADSLEQGIEVVSGTYARGEPEAWWVAVDLFWDMPPSAWPADIQRWAERTDDALAAGGNPGSVALELQIAKGDAGAARARMQQMLAGGTATAAIATGLRQTGYRWPGRQEIVGTLLSELEQRSQ